MRLRPAGWPWLLCHEIRLAWHDTGGARVGLLLSLGLLLWLAVHAAAWVVLRFLLRGAPTAGAIAGIGAMLGFMFTLMLAQAITASVNVLFDRGDLDLLLASPLEPRSVFVVRGLGVAVKSVLLYALLLTPFAHVGLFTGKPELMAIYPTLASLALLATALGMAATLTLVRLLGARRARTVAQVLGALVGAAFFLAVQANNLFGHERTERWAAALNEAASQHGILDAASPLWWPADALLGHPVPLLAVVLVGLASFVVVMRLTANRFLAGTQESMTDAAPIAQAADAHAARFRGGLWRIVIVKEWKLLGRDPQLIAQTLLQTLYLLPLVFLGGRNHALGHLFVPAVVVASATLASGLAWLTMAAEDAPELIASAPVDLGAVRRMKLVAALLPVWAIVAPLAIYLALSSPSTALVLAFCVLASTLSAGLIHLGMPSSGSRKDMKRRAKGNLGASLLETLSAFAWAGLAWCLLALTQWFWLIGGAAVLALAAPALAALLGRTRRREFASA